MAKEFDEFMIHETEDGRRLAFAVDRENRLLVNGEPVVTETRLFLDLWVKVAVIAAGGAATLLAIIEFGRIVHWWQ